jgi:SAM-dependent methyltransferase
MEFRRYHFDACVLLLSGEPGYHKVKAFSLLIGARRMLVFDKDLQWGFCSPSDLVSRLFVSGKLERGVLADRARTFPSAALMESERPRQTAVLNKGAFHLPEDLQVISVRAIADDIARLKEELREKSLKFTTWLGDFTSFNENAERAKLWENAWVLAHSGVRSGSRILDAGGASTIFSFYLAAKECEVHVIDSDWYGQGTVTNAVAVNDAMKWNMKVITGDITRPLPYPDQYFDSVFCICVLEHLTSEERKRTVAELARCLKPGGIMGLTMDYDIDRGGDKGLRFKDRDRLYSDVITPSGLSLYGNEDLEDEYDERFFLGALFLRK